MTSALSPTAAAALAPIAAGLGLTLAELVALLAPPPDPAVTTPPGLVLDAAGELTELRLDGLHGFQIRRELDEVVVRDQPALLTLSVFNRPLRRLVVAGAPRLRALDCTAAGLAALELADLPALETLDASQNALTALDLRACARLRDVNLYRNRLTQVQVPTELEVLRLGTNQLTAVAVAGAHLRFLDVDDNRLTRLDLAALPALEELHAADNQLAALTTSANPRLHFLFCAGNQLTALDTRGNPALRDLLVERNQLAALDLAPTPALTYLACGDNRIAALDLRSVPRLARLDCAGNALARLDLAAVPGLVQLDCARNPLAALDLRAVPGLAVASLPPLADDQLRTTELQRHRIPELRERFGLRKVPRALAQMDGFELHLTAVGWNRDDGSKRLTTIAKAAACDLGTALWIYWRSWPHRYLQYASRREVPAEEREAWDLVRAIEERAVAGGYISRRIPFDPRHDTTHATVGTDWTVDPAPGPRVREIPPVLFEPCAGADDDSAG